MWVVNGGLNCGGGRRWKEEGGVCMNLGRRDHRSYTGRRGRRSEKSDIS